MTVKSKAVAALLLLLLLHLSAPALNSLHVHFTCRQGSSDSGLVLGVINDGPDTLPEGTVVYYFYATPQSALTITGSHTLDADLPKGGVFKVTLSDASQTKITACGCSLKPFKPRPVLLNERKVGGL
jgi:hypothetical protein